MNNTAANLSSTTTPATMTGFMPGPHCGRGTLDIIWSCLSTTLLAIWVSLHLDVDPPHLPKVPLATALRVLRDHNFNTSSVRSEWPLKWRKVYHASVGLILPEPIVTESILRLFEALKLKDILITSGIKGFENFSLRQAFFIVHQGVYFKDDDDDRANPLWDELLGEFARTGRLEFGDLPTDEHIADRSKSDWLLKSISVIQTLWFIANITYRVCAGLQVSLLEDLTAAYAFCGLIQFTAWFRCPQDVCQPFIVQLRSKSDIPVRITYLNLRRRETSFWMKKGLLGYPLLACIAFSLSAAVFNGIHLAAWRYSFASVTEQWLWRFCSLAMIPLLIFMYWAKSNPSKLVQVILFNFSRILYGISRLIMISLAFAAFRKAPVGIYKDATWTDLIPHI